MMRWRLARRHCFISALRASGDAGIGGSASAASNGSRIALPRPRQSSSCAA
jgi:hypothetical protein